MGCSSREEDLCYETSHIIALYLIFGGTGLGIYTYTIQYGAFPLPFQEKVPNDWLLTVAFIHNLSKVTIAFTATEESTSSFKTWKSHYRGRNTTK
jgi:hypothetical protein